MRVTWLVTMVEVGSGRVPSLERVTAGVGSASGAETKKLNSSRPSWLVAESIGIHNPSIEYGVFYVRNTEIFWCRFTFDG